jgi:hypothetical protein
MHGHNPGVAPIIEVFNRHLGQINQMPFSDGTKARPCQQKIRAHGQTGLLVGIGLHRVAGIAGIHIAISAHA